MSTLKYLSLKLLFLLQDYLHASLGELLDVHILQDSSGITGKVILELGYIETYVLRSCRNQSASDIRQLPDQEGSTLYKLLTDPDNVNLEQFPPDIFAVSILR